MSETVTGSMSFIGEAALKKNLSAATLRYESRRAYLIDLLQESDSVSSLNLLEQNDAWNAYHEASTELMRVQIALANTKRRAKNKKAIA